jgi:hypothetical protein
MANHRNATAVLVIGALTLIVGSAGLYLGFKYGRGPQTGPAVPKQPDRGPILYEMRSIRSEPDRVRFEWAEIKGAKGYRITVLSPSDDSLFTSPNLTTTAWVIPPDLRSRLAPQSVYHWKVTVMLDGGETRASDPAAFATQ